MSQILRNGKVVAGLLVVLPAVALAVPDRCMTEKELRADAAAGFLAAQEMSVKVSRS